MLPQASSDSANRNRPSSFPNSGVSQSGTTTSQAFTGIAQPSTGQRPAAASHHQIVHRASATQDSASAQAYAYDAHTTGALLFDENGLPQEYFMTAQISLENWEQLIFQLLGLRWLLMSSLQFESFSFARASSGNHTAILLRQRETYVALLTENLQERIYDLGFRQWLANFELATLRRDRRFQSL